MRLATAILLVGLGMSAAAAQPLPADFVYLRDADPSIVQDMRYATANNFVGRVLNGYEAGECVVTRSVGHRTETGAAGSQAARAVAEDV